MSGAYLGPERAPLGGRDTTERLGVDDMATLCEEQSREAALREQQLRAERTPRSRPGVCTNCGEACMPHVVYCDADCRADHQSRENAARRQGLR
ncbi:hypothetical protein SNE35_28730 [Paucibacter sp. R3-3]|uniref:DUF2116 family Zn-ribbon domain-containing protein n=1 Tax=Roseateles agri TaxID=3098619 RepID=A0ABU5DQC6_9BURK|nr:hypothetical protein [Paucibacter sp. R3-3]MDY0748520.1 hypothetical protein [Paucibacter sp. R3-3]